MASVQRQDEQYGSYRSSRPAEVATRNPDKQYGDYALDNHRSRNAVSPELSPSTKFDINELLKDPTSDILMGDHAASGHRGRSRTGDTRAPRLPGYDLGCYR